MTKPSADWIATFDIVVGILAVIALWMSISLVWHSIRQQIKSNKEDE